MNYSSGHDETTIKKGSKLVERRNPSDSYFHVFKISHIHNQNTRTFRTKFSEPYLEEEETQENRKKHGGELLERLNRALANVRSKRIFAVPVPWKASKPHAHTETSPIASHAERAPSCLLVDDEGLESYPKLARLCLDIQGHLVDPGSDGKIFNQEDARSAFELGGLSDVFLDWLMSALRARNRLDMPKLSSAQSIPLMAETDVVASMLDEYKVDTAQPRCEVESTRSTRPPRTKLNSFSVVISLMPYLRNVPRVGQKGDTLSTAVSWSSDGVSVLVKAIDVHIRGVRAGLRRHILNSCNTGVFHYQHFHLSGHGQSVARE